MTMLFRLRQLALIPLLAVASLTALAENLTEAEVEQLVHDYLLEHPEVVQQALERYQEQQQAAQEAAELDRLDRYQDDLIADSYDPVGGNPDGSVTLVEFFDYNCGYCKRANATVQALIDANPELRVVYKELPILAETSVTAARASLAVSKLYPQHYESFHRALLERRSALQQDSDVWNILADIDGVSTDTVRVESQSPWVERQLARNQLLARRLRISGTPSFVVGDTLLRGAYPQADIQEAIDEAS